MNTTADITKKVDQHRLKFHFIFLAEVQSIILFVADFFF
jgi:hypothetical protein